MYVLFDSMVDLHTSFVQDTAEQMTQCLSSCTHAWSIFDRAS